MFSQIWTSRSNPSRNLGMEIELFRYFAPNSTEGEHNLCLNTNGTDFILLIDAYGGNPIARYGVIAQLPRNVRDMSYDPPILKNYYTYYGPTEHISRGLNIICIRIYPDDRRDSFIGQLITLFDQVVFSYKCDPCIGNNLKFEMYLNFRTFPTGATVVFKSMNFYMETFSLLMDFCTSQYVCQGVYTSQFCLYTTYNLWRTSLFFDETFRPINVNSVSYYDGNIRFWRLTTETDFSFIYANNFTYGIGGFQHETTSMPCYLEKIYFRNLNNPPFVPVYRNATGERKSYNATIFTDYVAYRYSGIGGRHRCDISNNYTLCTDSSIPRCANNYREGFFCDIDISQCRQNKCIFSNECWGTSNNQICVCIPGGFGPFCDKFTCNRPCLHSKCSSPNSCGSCDPGWDGNSCNTTSCNNYRKCLSGTCDIRNNRRFCDCSPNRFFGTFCQIVCNPVCVHGVCGYANGQPICICEKGFYGNDCNIKISTSKRLLSADLQFYRNIGIYVGAAIVLIILCYIIQIKFLIVREDATLGKVATISMNMLQKQTLIPNNIPNNFGNNNPSNVAASLYPNNPNLIASHYEDPAIMYDQSNMMSNEYNVYDNTQNLHNDNNYEKSNHYEGNSNYGNY